ncbi:unnamed protein product [Heterobilharzia americana]|nr:unnamed protein product [Heterobilharzia americana]CAH8444562.1 unnamed protein product [Heterobilharzia americana]
MRDNNTKKYPKIKFKCPLQIKCHPCIHVNNITTVLDAVNISSGRKNVTKLSPVALDCEMVGVGPEKSNALGRISIVDYAGEVLYDVIVKPEKEISDYRTPWSGIRQKDMSRGIPYSCVHEDVKSIIENRIVVGHMIENDFSVLNLKHPFHLVRDTGKVSYLKLLADFPVKIPVGLRALSLRLFGICIQDHEHCSTEDARASMALYRLVEKQWEEDLRRSLHKTAKVHKDNSPSNNCQDISSNDLRKVEQLHPYPSPHSVEYSLEELADESKSLVDDNNSNNGDDGYDDNNKDNKKRKTV